MKIWQFRYKRGPAPGSGFVEASSQDRAELVARAVCERDGLTWLGATVTAFILGDESMLPKEEKAAPEKKAS